MGIYHEAELPAGRAGVAGMFTIIGRKSDGSGRERLIAPRQKNLITDAGLNRIFTGAIITNCHLGTGNTPAAAGDTALEGFVATSSSSTVTSGYIGTAPYHAYITLVFTFPAAASAYTAREVGVGWSATNDSLWARALIRDAWDAPLEAVIEAGEVVIVKYEYHYYAWTGDVPFEILVFGEVYDGIMRPAMAGDGAGGYGVRWSCPVGIILMNSNGGTGTYPSAYSGEIQNENTRPLTTAAGATTQISAPAYAAGSHKRIGSYQWATSTANFTDGIKSVWVQATSMNYQIGFTHRTDTSKGLLKTSSNSLILNLTTPVLGRMA